MRYQDSFRNILVGYCVALAISYVIVLKTQILMLPQTKFVSISLIALIVAVMVVAQFCLYQNASATYVIGQQGVQYSIYYVVIQGQAMDIPFQRQGMLLITQVPIGTAGTQNGVNPFEVFLISGNPGGTPESGAIGL